MKLLLLVLAAALIAFYVGYLHADEPAAKIDLNTDTLGPRTIEELTEKSIVRDYGLAWRTLRDSLNHNQPGALEGYFTGFAKDDFSRLVQSQLKTGVHVRYSDRNHRLTAIFYSPSGDAMQLRDRATLEMQILDGTKLLSTQQVTRNYLVLMTPGADRWLVRDLQSIPEGRP
jgi:hypothetical protein